MYKVFLIKGYKQDKAFIVAQSPMKNTIRDFWKMIHDRQCASVVMLCETIEDGRVSYNIHLLMLNVVIITFYLFAGSLCRILARKWYFHLR